MTGGPTHFGGLKIYTLFGSRDLSRIFLGLKKIRLFFLGLIPERTFRLGFLLQSVDQKNIHLKFFKVLILLPGIFLGVTFQACVFSWVCNMKLCRKTRSSYLGKENLTHFIETRFSKVDKAVCIYAVFSHT